MIGNKFNFDDVYFRDLTVCLLDLLEGKLKWVNRFSDGDRQVEVPMYYSLTGDERYLLDSFSDDVVSNNRLVEINTDIIPRGHITLKSWQIKSDDFTNPNVWLKTIVENESEIKTMLSKVRAIPIQATYDLSIKVKSEIDVFKCSQAIMNTLWLYRYMYFEYNFMNIDALVIVPDTEQVIISRDKNLTSDNTIKIDISLEVHSYYPAFMEKLEDYNSAVLSKWRGNLYTAVSKSGKSTNDLVQKI
jgi:hypothetical protein